MRFAVKATNSLEPCLDELEVFNGAGENVALAGRGTTVTTSGDTTVADRHEQRFINDGRYGNSRSWMSNEPGGGWAVLEFPKEEEITRVVWSRDRESQFEDRLPTEYRIEVAGAAGDWRVVADSSDRRPFVAGMDTGPSFTLAGLAPTEAAEAKRLLDEKQSLAAKIKAGERGADKLNTESPISDYSAARQRDFDVRLLWRYPSRRIEAETLRDSMLAVSGRLNLQMYGRGYNLFEQRGGLSGFKPVENLTAGNQRRMIYAHKVRRATEAVFGAIDCPDAGQSTALRRTSTTPIQALNLFNSRFTLEQAQTFAARVTKEVGAEVTRQIQRAYQLALGRDASPEELRDAAPVVSEHGLGTLCRVLFNSIEFLFIP